MTMNFIALESLKGRGKKSHLDPYPGVSGAEW